MINKAPLPFRGQKNQWANTFKDRIAHVNADTYVDLFGGSGILSYWCKQIHPTAKVIYNDFDNYTKRLENIPRTNQLLIKVRSIVDYESRDINDQQRAQIIDAIKQEEKENGFVDYITLSAGLLFSGKYFDNFDDFCKNKFYNTVPKQLYNADGYLAGIDVVHCDYSECVERYNRPGVCFLVDPPYLSTQCTMYKNVEYWTLKDYLNVCRVLSKIDNFVYFSSDRSQIVELFEYMQTNFAVLNPFADAEVYYKKKQIAHNNDVYTDTMYIKTTPQNQVKTPYKIAI